MSIQRKRAYDTITAEDGYRVLTERLWPRGLSKAQLKIDEWLKELAPSAELRLWFKHDPSRWQEFEKRYREELSAPEKQQELARLLPSHWFTRVGTRRAIAPRCLKHC